MQSSELLSEIKPVHIWSLDCFSLVGQDSQHQFCLEFIPLPLSFLVIPGTGGNPNPPFFDGAVIPQLEWPVRISDEPNFRSFLDRP